VNYEFKGHNNLFYYRNSTFEKRVHLEILKAGIRTK